MTNKYNKPPLKYAGNKVHILDRILPLLPKGKRLVEPFFGSGAVFLNTNYERYSLSDASYPLMFFYQELCFGPKCIGMAEKLFRPENNTREQYKRIRDEFNKTKDPTYAAAHLIYLNRHCYNGLFRFSQKTGFNAPFGRYAKPYFPGPELTYMAGKLYPGIMSFSDFEGSMDLAGEDDVIYADPPYIPKSSTASFTGYNGQTFTNSDQARLRDAAIRAAKRGATVVISNQACPLAYQLYEEADHIEEFPVASQMSCDGGSRTPRSELLVVYRPGWKAR